jgi:hypothetical protein
LASEAPYFLVGPYRQPSAFQQHVSETESRLRTQTRCRHVLFKASRPQKPRIKHKVHITIAARATFLWASRNPFISPLLTGWMHGGWSCVALRQIFYRMTGPSWTFCRPEARRKTAQSHTLLATHSSLILRWVWMRNGDDPSRTQHGRPPKMAILQAISFCNVVSLRGQLVRLALVTYGREETMSGGPQPRASPQSLNREVPMSAGSSSAEQRPWYIQFQAHPERASMPERLSKKGILS